jgi:hypothetical protein
MHFCWLAPGVAAHGKVLPCCGDGGAAAVVGDCGIAPYYEKQPHDVLAAMFAGEPQRRAAADIAAVDGGGGAGVGQQAMHHLRKAVADCDHQRDRMSVGCDGGVGAPLQQQRHHGETVPPGREVQSGGTPVTPFVGCRPLVEQPPHHSNMTPPRRFHQGRPAIPGPGVEEARAVPHEPLHLTQVAPTRSLPDGTHGA